MEYSVNSALVSHDSHEQSGLYQERLVKHTCLCQNVQMVGFLTDGTITRTLFKKKPELTSDQLSSQKYLNSALTSPAVFKGFFVRI